MKAAGSNLLPDSAGAILRSSGENKSRYPSAGGQRALLAARGNDGKSVR